MICRGWIPKVRLVRWQQSYCSLHRIPTPKSVLTFLELDEKGKGNDETAATSPDNGDESQETGGTSGSASSSSAQPTEAKNLAHKDVAIQIGTIFDKIKEENAREKQE